MDIPKLDQLAIVLVVAALATAPLVFTSSYTIGVLTVAFCYGIWAASWDFMSGLTGRENFGHSLFIGAGAYTAGFLNVNFGANPWWSLLAAPFFALAMLSASAVMQNLTIIFSTYTGGQDGLNGLFPILDSTLAYYYLTLTCLVATTIILKLVANSTW